MTPTNILILIFMFISICWIWSLQRGLDKIIDKMNDLGTKHNALVDKVKDKE